MKLIYCVPPVGVLIIAAAWLTHLRESFPKDKARGLAMKISDEELRAELLQRLD